MGEINLSTWRRRALIISLVLSVPWIALGVSPCFALRPIFWWCDWGDPWFGFPVFCATTLVGMLVSFPLVSPFMWIGNEKLRGRFGGQIPVYGPIYYVPYTRGVACLHLPYTSVGASVGRAELEGFLHGALEAIRRGEVLGITPETRVILQSQLVLPSVMQVRGFGSRPPRTLGEWLSAVWGVPSMRLSSVILRRRRLPKNFGRKNRFFTVWEALAGEIRPRHQSAA